MDRLVHAEAVYPPHMIKLIRGDCSGPVSPQEICMNYMLLPCGDVRAEVPDILNEIAVTPKLISIDCCPVFIINSPVRIHKALTCIDYKSCTGGRKIVPVTVAVEHLHISAHFSEYRVIPVMLYIKS